ncbi:MAG: hypothetical protein SFV22_17270 [Saprospiraceae bacterium]|nr:hypothetical protein [Saprospiraceae bacterium]
MKKNIYLTLLTCAICADASAQLENKGWWTRDLFSYQYQHNPADAAQGRQERTYHRFFTQPEIGYVLNKRTMVGIVAQYETLSDRFAIAPAQSGLTETQRRFYGAGPLLRFYFPLAKRVLIMPEFFAFFSREKTTSVYSELGVPQETSTAYNTFGAGAFPSLVCFLSRDLALSLTVVRVQYYQNEGSRSLTVEVNPQQWLLGVEYYFEKRKRKEE